MPANVTSIVVIVSGAQGTAIVSGTSSSLAGGLGGTITATLNVTPGQTWFVNVGGGALSPGLIAGGYGGGGQGGKLLKILTER